MKLFNMRFAIAASIVAIASTAVAAPTWTGAATVTSVYAGKVSKAVMVVGLPNVAGCTVSDINFDPASADANQVLTLATSALLSGKKLNCHVDGCVSGTWQKGLFCKLDAN